MPDEMTWIAPVYLRILMDRAASNPETPDDVVLTNEALEYAQKALDGEVPAPEAKPATVAVTGGEKCRAVKHGGTTLLCGEPKDHGGTWHKATYTESREVVYDGSHHVIHMTETVTWEPVDHVREATRHIMAGLT